MAISPEVVFEKKVGYWERQIDCWLEKYAYQIEESGVIEVTVIGESNYPEETVVEELNRRYQQAGWVSLSTSYSEGYTRAFILKK